MSGIDTYIFNILCQRNEVCPLDLCRSKSKRRIHTLIKKATPLCLHSILAVESSSLEGEMPVSLAGHQLDYERTVKKVVQKIKENFPSDFRQCEEGTFASDSKSYIDNLIMTSSIEEAIANSVPRVCEDCGQKMILWQFKEPKSYFISLGNIKKVKIPVYTCQDCKCAYYPDLYSKGLIPIHNSLIVSFDLLLDAINSLRLGAPLTETIKYRLKLLGSCSADVVSEDLDVHNLSIKLEKFTIAFASILVKTKDLDNVTCYLCGCSPKIVSSGMFFSIVSMIVSFCIYVLFVDGNTKDSIRVTNNMIYNYEGNDSIPDLETFRQELLIEVLMSTFFRHISEKNIDMLRLPVIMAPCMMRQSINSEALKKSIMEKEFSYDRDLLEKFQRLLDNKEVNLRNINDLGSKQIKEISIKLGIFDPSKSTEILKTDLVNLQKIVVGKFTFGKRFV